MFKFSFNATTLREMDLFDALRHIQAAGYDGVELMFNDTHLHPLKTSRQRIAEIRDFCLSENIVICAIAAGGDGVLSDRPYQPTFFDPEPSGRARRLDFLTRGIEVAEYLAVPVIDFNSGPIHPDVSRAQSLEMFHSAVNSLLSRGGNVTLGLEPEPNFVIGTTVDAIDLIQQVNHPRLRLTTDIGHVNVSENDCYAAIEHASPFSCNMHIEDIKGRVHAHEIPGKGDIDFDRVFEILNRSGYSNYIAVELHYHHDRWQRALDESINYLNRYRTVAA
jgi:sugar phosphate isomerase/epimerase